MLRLSFFAASAGLGLAALALAGCGVPETPPVSAAPPVLATASRIDAEAISGVYAVRGVTVQAQTGRQREISGTLELDARNDRYEVSFELGTTAPDFEEPVPVTVRGTGSGFIVGDVLTGTTEEWMALTAPMEESRGAELPANAGIAIVSTSQASLDADGTLNVMLQNQPRPGQDYQPSVTVLAGRAAEPR